jgi:pyridoxal phosphate enzyme (YggS family)
MPEIGERTKRILDELPSGVTLVVAAKTRTPEEIRAAIDGGARIVGQNYVQEASVAIETLGRDAAEWHMLGHLQKNKVRQAVHLFDTIQTVDSLRLAERIDRECRKIDRVMPVLVEVNSAREPQKSGVLPEDTEALVRAVSALKYVSVRGLMTMGPFADDPETIRPVFRETKRLFDALADAATPSVRMEILSMGMSDSYRVAIEEGANMVRLGTILFGSRT